MSLTPLTDIAVSLKNHYLHIRRAEILDTCNCIMMNQSGKYTVYWYSCMTEPYNCNSSYTSGN